MVALSKLNYGILESGSYELHWDGSDQYGIPVHSGLYISIEEIKQTKLKSCY